MKSINIFMVAAMAAAMLTGCGEKEKTASNGLTYTVLREGEGETSEQGDYLVFNMSYKSKSNDSLWYDTNNNMPQLIQQEDSVWKANEGMVQSIFAAMKEGDSITFDVTVQELFTKSWKQEVPPTMDPNEVIQFNCGLEDVLDETELMEWYQAAGEKQKLKEEAKAVEQMETDKQLITAYLQENDINAEESETGIYIEMLEEGAGKEASTGDTVKVNYAGYLLSGEVFDTNIESVAREKNVFQEGRPYQPYELILGQGEVIKGWDQGLTELKAGDKARFFIPSPLAYGSRQRSEIIKPNAILIFDIELVDVK